MADFDDVSSNLRSVLESSKRPILLRNLMGEYKVLNGLDIPFKALGFQTLEHYLRSIPQVVRLFQNSKGELCCEAVISKATAHVCSLVSQQKVNKTSRGSKTSPRFSSRPPPSSSYSQPSWSSRPSSSRPTIHSNPPQRRNAQATGTWQTNSNYNQPQQKPRDYSSHYERHAHQNPVPRSSFSRPTTPKADTNNAAQSNLPPLVPFVSAKTYNGPPRFSKPPQRSTKAISPLPTNITRETPSPKAEVVEQPKPATPPPLADQNRTGAKIIRAELETFAQTHNLGTVTCKIQYTTVHGIKNFFGVVKVGNRSFSSYPIEKFSSEEAEVAAFKCALDDLRAQKGVADNIPVSSVEYVSRRLIEILTPKPHGIWNTHIPNEYTKIFKEHLPDRWEDIVHNDKNFTIESIGDGRSIVFIKTVQNDYKVVRRSSVISDGSVQSDASNSSGSPQPNLPVLNLPLHNFWDVYVTIVNTASDVCIRLLGDEYSVKFNDMANEMDLFYMNVRSDSDSSVSVVSVGDLLATEINAGWHRVEIIEIIDENFVLCLFVDHGDYDEVNIDDLYPLEPRFKTLPFQVIHCQLAGLEGFSDHFYTNLFDIVGKSFVAEVVSRDESLSLILFDTSNEEDVNVNDLLKEKFLNEIQTPKLKDAANGVSNVFLSHTTVGGDIFLQIDSPTFEILESFVDAAAKASQEKKVESVEQNKMYLGKYPVDDHWYRVVSLPGNIPIGEEQVEVFFVDYGNIDRIPVSSLMLLDSEHEKLIKFPHQAIRCRLNNVPASNDLVWTEKTTERLIQLAPDDYPLIAKVVQGSGDTNIQLVELFKRIEPSNELVSVNQTLSLDQDVFSKKSSQSKVNSIVRRHSSLDVQCISPNGTAATQEKVSLTKSNLNSNRSPIDIPSVNLPSVGDSIDVHITLAPNPFHFMMQPWLGGEALDLLIIEMNAHYDKQGLTVTVDELVEGGTYALNYMEVWYRVRVHLINDRMVSAFFIDYGDHSIVEIDCLRLLDNKFRHLPAQILRGRLGGIQPKDRDWRPEDCVFFRELTEENQFVAEVMDVKDTTDDDNNAKQVVVRLIDTSVKDKTVYIHHILIESGIAILDAKPIA